MHAVELPADHQRWPVPEPGQKPWWALGASGVAHAVLILSVALIVFTRPVPIEPPPVPVEMVTEAEFAAFEAVVAERTQRVPQTPAEPAPARIAPAEPAMTTATNFYAGQALLDPANREVRDALPTLARADRIVELCSLEALEQIHRARPEAEPDMIAVFAFAEVEVTVMLAAPGGAFREDGRWYRVRFDCTAAADLQGVTAFAFAIGEAVPGQEEWAGPPDAEAED